EYRNFAVGPDIHRIVDVQVFIQALDLEGDIVVNITEGARLIPLPVDGDVLAFQRLGNETRDHEVRTLQGPIGIEEAEYHIGESEFALESLHENLTEVLHDGIRQARIERRGILFLRELD